MNRSGHLARLESEATPWVGVQVLRLPPLLEIEYGYPGSVVCRNCIGIVAFVVCGNDFVIAPMV